MDEKLSPELKEELTNKISLDIDYDIHILINQSIIDYVHNHNIEIGSNNILFFNDELRESILLKILKLK